MILPNITETRNIASLIVNYLLSLVSKNISAFLLLMKFIYPYFHIKVVKKDLK